MFIQMKLCPPNESDMTLWMQDKKFWHTLREDGSKYRLKFMLDRKELTFTLDDFRIIFHLPQANDNNHALCSPYHNLQDDDIMKNIFNSGRNKNKVGMRIPPWMITEEINLTEHYMMYAEVFGLDVPLIQSQPTESTQGTHRKTSAPRSPNPATEPAELEPMSDKESPEVEIVREKDEETSKDTEEKGRREEYRGALGISSQFPHQLDHLGISLLLYLRYRETSGIDGYSSYTIIRFMPQKSSDQLANNLHDVLMETLPSLVKEKVTKKVKKEVPGQVRDQVPVYVVKGLIMERKTTKEETGRLISKAILQECGLICQADPLLQQQDIAIWLALQMKFEKTQVPHTACRPSAVRPRDQDDPHDDAHPEGENSAKRQKTSEYEAYVSGESSSGQVNVEEPGPSTSGNQEQDDEFDFWTDSYASDDDEIPTKQVSQDIMEEISLTIDEAKLKKMADEMLRQRCTSGDEHQYHIDQMKNFLQSDIVWETKGHSDTPHPPKDHTISSKLSKRS
ncbi:hypothetical protein Tco_1114599 [Tanacetum coccineum]|uniref:Uncharacterized protein n=1 Tax=Tanacetum coccineum TaxID=301880 RepID=A0ABQ5IVZ5_9ASTR